MRKLCRVGFMLLFAVTVSSSLYGQNYFFAESKEPAVSITGKRVIIPEAYRTVVMNNNGMELFLKNLPSGTDLINKGTAPVIELPMPDGSTKKFRIWESPVMEPLLAARFTNIKTFTGQGIDDPTATIKMDLTELGFHALIISDITGNIFIDPYSQLETKHYNVYYKKDFKNKDPFIEQGVIPPSKTQKITANRPMGGPCMGAELRTYRFAVACTGEYSRAATGLSNPTVAQALSAIVTSINRVDGIYEKELAISLNLVANNNLVVFVDPVTDPFTANNDGEALLDESQTVIDDKIGSANYDIGHTFSTGGGGIAELECVCTSTKARGVTGLAQPVGDPYDIDYVAHEMGHQFGASHTFNAVTSSCSGNRSANTAVEPGGGITIMAYAGICGTTNDLAQNSIPYFHGVSMDEINTFTTAGDGSLCAVSTITGNTAPVVNAGNSYVIPKSTFFVLTGSATDMDGDALTYSWEEVDTGPAGNLNSPTGNAPLFRSFVPVISPSRYFPQLSNQVRNTTTIGELLPSYGRDLNFRLTARDNRAGGGGSCFDETTLQVDDNSGPFVITVPSASGISWQAGSTQTVTWDVANTNNAPVNCANVSIQLSIDSGYTFPITILASTPNDGSEQIVVPSNLTAKARIRVMAIGNVFYDISNANFSIIAAQTGFNFTIAAAKQIICADPNSTTASITLGTESILGYSAPIELSASGNPAGTTVSFSDVTITPGQSTVVTLSNVNTLSNASYIVTVTGVSGTITRTHELTFIVQPGTGPVITSQPEGARVCENEAVVFNAAASGALSYQWQVINDGGTSFTNIANANSPALTISNAGIGQNNSQYRVLVTGQCNVTTSDAALLTVHTLPTIDLAASPLTSLTPGLTTTLTATPSPSAGGAVSITWFKDETPITVPGNTLEVDVTGLGNYKVKIEEAWTDGNTCVNESETVAITGEPSTSLFIYPSPNNGQFKVSYYNSAGGNTKQTVVVYDVKGAKVYHKLFTFSGPYELHDIDLRGKAKGIYFVVIGDANGKKIIDGKVLIN